MIVPITQEGEWLAVLRDARPWTPPAVPTVVIAPHPDDETLAAGGLIAQLREAGVPVDVIAVTDGENAYEGEQGLGPVREEEQRNALARLGVAREHIHRLHLTDSGVTTQEAVLAAALGPLLRGAGHILAPWPHDFHPDHESTGRAALAVAHRLRIPVTLYFFWTWHRGTPQLLAEMPLLRLELSQTQQRARREALLCHASQLRHSSGAPILPEDLLAPAFRAFEVFYADPSQPVDDAERDPSSAAFFDGKYRNGSDPWNFATSTYEQARYDAVVRSLAGRRYAHGFEPGCSIGELSKRLITLCDQLEAIDFSAAAIETARVNNGRLGIDYRVMGLPERLPLYGFDLIVLSEIGYYFPLAQWTEMVRSMVDTATPGTTFLAAHWLGHSKDHQTHGDEVHAVLRNEPRLHLLHEERHPGFRIDRLERRT